MVLGSGKNRRAGKQTQRNYCEGNGLTKRKSHSWMPLHVLQELPLLRQILLDSHLTETGANPDPDQLSACLDQTLHLTWITFALRTESLPRRDRHHVIPPFAVIQAPSFERRMGVNLSFAGSTFGFGGHRRMPAQGCPQLSLDTVGAVFQHDCAQPRTDRLGNRLK